MVNCLCVVSLLAVLVVHQAQCCCCTSSSGRFPAWDIGPNAEIYPTYDSGAVGVGVTIKFKRGAADMPRDAVPDRDDVFRKLDLNGDGYIEVGEWVRHHGSAKNFDELLKDDDVNRDRKISKGEFQNLKLYYKTS